MLLKARLSSKLEAPRLQRFLPQKLGSFKEARFRHACLRSFKKLKACFFIFFKKINQNWNKTLGSWHYWYKPLIWHVFSVTYLSKKDILSVTCPKRLKPNPQPPSSSLFLFFLDFSPWNSNPPSFFFLLYFFPFGYLLGTNDHVAMSSYS